MNSNRSLDPLPRAPGRVAERWGHRLMQQLGAGKAVAENALDRCEGGLVAQRADMNLFLPLPLGSEPAPGLGPAVGTTRRVSAPRRPDAGRVTAPREALGALPSLPEDDVTATPPIDRPHQAAPADLERPFQISHQDIRHPPRKQEFRAANQVLHRKNSTPFMNRLSAELSRLSPIANTWSGGTRLSGVLFISPSSVGLQDIVFHPVRQRFQVAPQHHVDAAVVGDIVARRLARHQLAIDVELALLGPGCGRPAARRSA